jgi:hypothetical protein
MSAALCHACGYDLSAAPASRCPECGCEPSAWASRWMLRLSNLALTMLAWGLPLTAAAWFVNITVRSWFTAAGQNFESLGTVRPTEALVFLPAMVLAAGLVLLAAAAPPGTAGRRLGLITGAAGAGVLCLMLAQRALAYSAVYGGPAWMRLSTMRDGAWWALAVLAPIAAGAALVLLARTGSALGLARLALWCRRAAWWIPFAAIAGTAALTAYEWAATVATRSPTVVSSVPVSGVPISGVPVPGVPVSGVAPPAPPVVNQLAPTPRATTPSGAVTLQRATPVFLPVTMMPRSIPWFWDTGPVFARALLFAACAAAGSALWLTLIVIRARARDAAHPHD